MSDPNFMAIHPAVVEIFQSGLNVAEKLQTNKEGSEEETEIESRKRKTETIFSHNVEARGFEQFLMAFQC